MSNTTMPLATTRIKITSLRDIAVIELLFATGIRISELCTIPYQEYRPAKNNIIVIKGKGAKERLIHICDKNVITALNKYHSEYDAEIHSCGYFFVNNIGNRLSEQSRKEKWSTNIVTLQISSSILLLICFRHSFATLLFRRKCWHPLYSNHARTQFNKCDEIYTCYYVKTEDILESKAPPVKTWTYQINYSSFNGLEEYLLQDCFVTGLHFIIPVSYLIAPFFLSYIGV